MLTGARQLPGGRAAGRGVPWRRSAPF